MSSFNSALNSTCTLFSLEMYKYIKKDVSEAQVIRSGKLFGIIIALFAMIIAPLLADTGSIFGYLQKMNGMYFIPILSVIVLSLLYKKMSPRAAKVGLVAGFLIIAIGYFVPPFTSYVEAMHEFHFLGAVFVTLIILMLIISARDKNTPAWEQRDVKAIDLTPWKYRYHVSIALAICVVLIYIIFAF